MKAPRLIERKVWLCTFCEYRQADMIHSGTKPLYHFICKHEKWKDYSHFKSYGRFIGDDDSTPYWCPVRKE